MNTNNRIPEESMDPKSNIAIEAEAFLDAIAGGADEDEADEVAFFANNPNGIVIDNNGDVLKSGPDSKIIEGEKIEFVNDETNSLSNKDSATIFEDKVTNPNDNENLDDEIALDESLVTFEDLGLSQEVLEAIKIAGYETPSPIQAKAIPALLQGANLLGTAQTGTGKTAAFTLPLLSRIKFNRSETSMLVLTPTRELAIQVAEAIQQYSVKMTTIHVVAIYGGQDISVQIRALKRHANIIVATPGRLIDHINRGTIVLNAVKAIVLDEADEMLDMGFMEDVDKILKEIPHDAQRALFSATMPTSVKKIIEQHLGEYEEALIEGKTTTVENIHQRFLMVKKEHKIEALARVLEGEEFDGVLIFVRTKQNTTEIAEKLESRGFNVAPLNGDLAQSMRERTINRLKMGKLDIVVATDVAARGIDVDRISLVVNYDIPYDTESYVHRIGRTGRAGRSGEAILFITPREKKMLKIIERATRQPIDVMEMPTADMISAKRVAAFKKKLKSVLSYGELDKFKKLVQELTIEGNPLTNGVENEDGHITPITAEDVAAAVIKIYQKKQPLFPELPSLEGPKSGNEKNRTGRDFMCNANKTNDFGLTNDEAKRIRKERKEGMNGVEEGFLRYYLGVGRIDHVTPKDIVGAIAGEGNINSSNIGRIKLFDKFSTVELPETLPQDVIDILSNMTIRGYDARFRVMTDDAPIGPAKGSRPRENRSERRAYHRDERGNFHRGERGGTRGNRGFNRAEGKGYRNEFGGERSSGFERNNHNEFGKNREDRRRQKFNDKPIRKDHDERDFGDKPFRKTRRFGRH